MTQTYEQEELKTQISFVSHEIRNHLSICDMYSRIIKKNLEKENIQNESINNALSCIQQSIQIIGANLLDLKSINSDCIQIFDFETICKKGVEMGKAYKEDKNIEFDFHIKNSALISVDENRFLSCLVNIIKNGIEAIEMKGIIKIYGEIKDNKAVLRISNNGKQIPQSKQDSIFNLGYTDKKCGNGFGLAICKKYLENQKGNIKLVKSTKTETQFEISVPV